ncbi:hypothetical protein BG004_000691, partial [Podila humilis]
GPFDGVMGFSQGASMASLLQVLLERPYLSEVMKDCSHAPFKFAIIVSGFEPRDSSKMGWYTQRYPILKEGSSMVDDTETRQQGMDKITNGAPAPTWSEGLLKHYAFKKPAVLYHDGGHYLPSNAASRLAYKSFVQMFV